MFDFLNKLWQVFVGWSSVIFMFIGAWLLDTERYEPYGWGFMLFGLGITVYFFIIHLRDKYGTKTE